LKVERNIKEENLRNEKTNNIEEYTDENSVEIDFEEDLGFISGSEESTETPEELLSRLNTIEQSIDASKVGLLTDLLNLYLLYSSRATVRDTLYNTKESENFIDTSNILSITTTMSVYTSGVFLDIADRALQNAISRGQQNRIAIARSAYWAALFAFIASIIAFSAARME
jgi:hypothetical protein